jgi:hypothetical protein
MPGHIVVVGGARMLHLVNGLLHVVVHLFEIVPIPDWIGQGRAREQCGCGDGEQYCLHMPSFV